MSDEANSERIEKLQDTIPAILDQTLQECVNSCREIGAVLSQKAQENPDDGETKRDLFMVKHLEVLYRVNLKNRKTLRYINKAIQELPNRQEFENLKVAVQAAINEQDQRTIDTEQKVVDTLQPINDLLKELQKLKDSKPFGDMYG
jgi:hypothetical protein